MPIRVTSRSNLVRIVWLAVTLLLLLGAGPPSTYGDTFLIMTKEPVSRVQTPPVVLQNGTAGTSTIYTNKTSAKASAIALCTAPTYYPNGYNVETGTYLSGSVPASVQSVDSNYFIVDSAGTVTSTTAYTPSEYNLLGTTTLVSGSPADLASNNAVYMTFRSYASSTAAQPLYTHQETTTIGGSSYYLLNLTSADTAGTTLSADAGTLGRKLMGRFVYPLTGIPSIPASTWTIYYRASQGHVNIESHGDVDLLIRMANGTIRSTIATHVANSATLAASTSWVTLSGTYVWNTYNVVDPADYLEVAYHCEVTKVKSGYQVNLRVDDNTLAVADQTRATNLYLPNQFTSEVEVAGSSNTQPWYQLAWSVDAAWTTGSVAVTIQVYNSTLDGYPTSGDGYSSYTSSSTPNTDELTSQTITTNPTSFRNGTGYWKIKIKGVKSTTIPFDSKADWTEYKPSHYSEYTVSTEFQFSSMSINTPSQLNFTVVTQYDVGSVNVTIQVWNYSSTSYVTSGDGYATYISTGAGNETINLNINTNPHFYTSAGNAKINVTGVLTTPSTYQQETNQIRLVYAYDGSSINDYLLEVTNTIPDPWEIRLKKYDSSNIGRLQNCTIYFRNATNANFTHLVIEDGSFTQSEGAWYSLASLETIYIVMTATATTAEASYVYAHLEIRFPGTSTYLQYEITFEVT